MPKTRKLASPVQGNSKTAKNEPTREEIALRAYQIYLKRNGAPGNALEDWVQAERELVGKGRKPRRKAAAKSLAA